MSAPASTVVPVLVYEDVARSNSLAVRGLRAEGAPPGSRPGGRVTHAQLSIGSGDVMIGASDKSPGIGKVWHSARRVIRQIPRRQVARGTPPILNTPTRGCIGAEESRLPLQDLLIGIQGDFLRLGWEQNISAPG